MVKRWRCHSSLSGFLVRNYSIKTFLLGDTEMKLKGCDAPGRILSLLLGTLGHLVAKHPAFFLMVPLLAAALLAPGLPNAKYVDDAEYLFSPRNGHSKEDRKLLDRYFPANESGRFSPTRATRLCRVGRALIVPKNGGTLLRNSIFEDISLLDQLLLNITVENPSDGTLLQYNDICAHWDGECVANSVLLLGKMMEDIESGRKRMYFPFTLDVDTLQVIILPAFLGGVQYEDDGEVTFAEAVTLNYFVAAQRPSQDALGKLWEEKFLQEISSHNFDNIKVVGFTSETLQQELDQNLRDSAPYAALSLLLLFLMSAITCLSSNCVRSKPWLGLLGVVSTALGVASAFGLLVYSGLPFTGINLAVPFLALGIGLDDVFVMIACWRRTNPCFSLSMRMKETMQCAGVSITITTVTDVLSFCIGMITPFAAIQIFCIYIATSVLFVYIFHITFFAACMAYSGELETQNRHGVVCLPMPRPPGMKERCSIYQLFCSGGIDDEISAITDNVHISKLRSKCSSCKTTDIFARLLSHPATMVIISIAFISYLCVSAWGIFSLQEGLEIRNLCRYNSEAARYHELESKYFRQYRIQVVINQELDYSDETVQVAVETMLSTFENQSYIGDPAYTESWLRSFMMFVQHSAIDVSNQEKFIGEVKQFVHGRLYELDLSWSPDGKRIIASRFQIQTEDMLSTEQGTKMVSDIRNLAQAMPFSVTVFSPYFVYFDQFLLVRPYTIQCVVVAAVIMMIVAAIFIPSLMCAFWVSLCIVSIEFGVVGLMVLWSIRLDTIAMVNLIMCIGFSVDFCAHITHAFLVVGGANSTERVSQALQLTGVPIIQGALSSVLALLPLIFVPSYIALVFFKVLVLVVVLGGAHALILLPLLFIWATPSSKCATVKAGVEGVVAVTITITESNSERGSSQECGSDDGKSSSCNECELEVEDQGLGTSADEGSESSQSTPRDERRVSSVDGIK